MEEKDVLEIFENTQALLEGHYLLSSGLHSSQYFQCAKVLQYPQYAEELAQKDELTGLNNRRAFFEWGHHAFEQSKRFGHTTSVIMMDIDHFKMINDNYGHSVGDKVLQAVAELLDLPENITADYIISLGYPTGPVKAPKRRSIDEAIISWIKE